VICEGWTWSIDRLGDSVDYMGAGGECKEVGRGFVYSELFGLGLRRRFVSALRHRTKIYSSRRRRFVSNVLSHVNA
jgi:hypothetical protein